MLNSRKLLATNLIWIISNREYLGFAISKDALKHPEIKKWTAERIVRNKGKSFVTKKFIIVKEK